MQTTPDPAREAFRRWLKHAGGIDAAAARVNCSPRTLQRIWSGAKPPHPRFLAELAIHARDDGRTQIAEALEAAARTEPTHA
jgi:hypothetical protein